MTETIDIGSCIVNKIKTRYANMNEKEFGSSNMVVDAYYPSYVINSLLCRPHKNNLSDRSCAISPFIANELGVYQVGIEDMCKMLGFKKNDLKLILNQVKLKKLELVLLGIGGTGMNFMHWTTELCNFTNTLNIFESIEIFEEDHLDLTNIFRFPQAIGHRNASKIHYIHKLDLIDSRSIISKTNIIKTPIRFNPNSTEYISSGNPIFYGAPDIITREFFSKLDVKANFISGTHGNNDCQLYINPIQNSDLQVESYGMINLSIFFMNQLKLTIEFLKLLASDTPLNVEKLVMEYSFSNEYSNGNTVRAGLNRTYNFPIQENTFVVEDDLNGYNIAESTEISDDIQERIEPQLVEPYNVTTTNVTTEDSFAIRNTDIPF